MYVMYMYVWGMKRYCMLQYYTTQTFGGRKLTNFLPKYFGGKVIGELMALYSKSENCWWLKLWQVGHVMANGPSQKFSYSYQGFVFYGIVNKSLHVCVM